MLLFAYFILQIISFKPIYLIAGFDNSPIYSKINNISLYPECPDDLDKIFIQSAKKSNKNFISKFPNCFAKILRLHQNSSTKIIQQLPGISTESTSIGDPSIFSDIFGQIYTKIKELGYQNNINFFSVGYNYYFHPITSEKVYLKLKDKIEQMYKQTGEKSILISYDQGTSFISIFLSNYSQSNWVKKYIDSVIFLSPTFTGSSSFISLFTQNLPQFAPNEELKKSIMRMPGLQILLPNYAIFENFTLNYNLNAFNASQSFEFLKQNGKVDSESEAIFRTEVEKYLKVPVPEPPVPSMILFQEKSEKTVLYAYNRQYRSNRTVISEGNRYLCSNWRSTKCFNLQETEIFSEKAANIVSHFLREHNERNPLKIKNASSIPYSAAEGDYMDNNYVNAHMVPNCKISYTASPSEGTYLISNLFDGDSFSYYVAKDVISATNNNTITIDFSETVTLDSFLIDTVYFTEGSSRRFDGCPTDVHIYSSIGNGPLTLVGNFVGNPVYPWSRIHFIFSSSVRCDKLKIDIVNCTYHTTTTNIKINIAELYFIQHIDFNPASIIPPDDMYSSYGYLFYHKIETSKFSYSASSSMPNHPISNAFDEDANTFYIPSSPNTNTFKNNIEVSFTETVELEAFFIDPKITNNAEFNGFPLRVNVYTSVGNGPYSLNTIFRGSPYSSWTRTVFVFPQQVSCDKIKLEFDDVTVQKVEGESNSPIICNLMFMRFLIKKTPLEQAIGDYIDNSYVKTHLIRPSEFTVEAPEGMSGYPIENAFDLNQKTIYLSSEANSDTQFTSFTITFKEIVALEAFLIYPVFRTTSGNRIYQGFPKVVYVYASSGDNPFTLRTIFTGTPVYPWALIQYVFPQILICDKIRLDFVVITTQVVVGNGMNLFLSYLLFIINFFPTSIAAATNDYLNQSFVNSTMINRSKFEFEAPEGLPSFSIDNIFDGNRTSYYISSKQNVNTDFNTLTFKFLETVSIKAMLYDSGYGTRGTTRTFYGFPTGLSVYASLGDDPLKLNTIFIGTPVYPWDRILFEFPQVVKCDVLQLVFAEVTVQTVSGASYYAPMIGDLYLIQRLIPDEPVQIPIEDVCQIGKHCNFEGTEDEPVQVTITSTNFNKVEDSEDGGALHLINAGINCEKISFSSCESKTGRGGGIYIHNEVNVNNKVTINNASFTNCKADYGGAIYIYSSTTVSDVTIYDCVFTTCQSTSSSDSSFNGGSAIFISAKKALITDCSFLRNKGQSQLTIYNSFIQPRTETDLSLLDRPTTSNIIKYCRFEIERQSKCSLFYSGGNNGVFCYVRNSVFVGRLYLGNYHIDGSRISKISPKLVVEWCKFASDASRALNNNNNKEEEEVVVDNEGDDGSDYATMQMQKQTFEYDEEKKSNNFNIFGYAVIGVVVLLVIIIIVIFRKQAETANMGASINSNNN